jgi:hypothetical protein
MHNSLRTGEFCHQGRDTEIAHGKTNRNVKTYQHSYEGVNQSSIITAHSGITENHVQTWKKYYVAKELILVTNHLWGREKQFGLGQCLGQGHLETIWVLAGFKPTTFWLGVRHPNHYTLIPSANANLEIWDNMKFWYAILKNNQGL